MNTGQLVKISTQAQLFPEQTAMSLSITATQLNNKPRHVKDPEINPQGCL